MSITNGNISGTCNELPVGRDLVTQTKFPLTKGTVVSVSCKPGFSLIGDRVITCLGDAEFTFSLSLPQCLRGKIVQSVKLFFSCCMGVCKIY